VASCGEPDQPVTPDAVTALADLTPMIVYPVETVIPVPAGGRVGRVTPRAANDPNGQAIN